ncbi:hypothetical protein JCM10908_006964 [Rhodotorula pacifica]|uniref:uncharacterized protein n=1 Tax=Rhodotorula pacifica TaxID=1495444 RepID=UPI0031828FD3
MAEPGAAPAADLAASNGSSSLQQELDSLRAEATRQQLEAEQSLHDLSDKLASAESSAQAARRDYEDLKAQLAQEQAKREEAERKVTLVEEGKKGDSSKEEEYRRRLEQADKEKRDLLEALEREQRERSAAEESLTSLRGAHASLQTAHSDLEGKLAEANSTARTSLLRLQTLQSTVSSLEADKTFLTAELERGRAEWSAFRREKHAELVRLQGELETKTIDEQAARTSLENLRKAHEQLKARHEETLADLAKVREELGANEGHFATEMASMRRLVELMEKREAERKQRLEDVEKALEEERAAMQEREAELQDQLLSERERADELDARNADLREALERGNNAARSTGPDGFGMPGSPGAASNASGSFMLSPAGQLAVRGQKSGRSYAEIYGEYIKMEEELAAERLETKRLSEVLAQILADIEERAPMLKEQRLEYERLSVEATELASQLAQALTDRDGSERRSKSLRLDVERLSTDNTILSQQLSDLGRQVRVLSRTLAAQENPSLGDVNDGDEEEEAIMRRAEQLGDTDSVVSAHLVTFTTINELQAQNQKLLKITRQMGRQLEQGEQEAIARREDEENKAVTEAHELILQLKEEIESQRARTEAYEKERDMFRRMLAQRSGHAGAAAGTVDSTAITANGAGDVDAARMLAEVQANFDAYRTEMSVDSQKLRDDLAQAQKDVAAARTDLAKSKAQAEFMTERFRLLTDSYEMQKTEMSQMSKRALELQQTLARHDMSTHKMSEEQIELRSAVDQLRHENNNLKSEREVLKSVEKRLGEENATLSKERAHLADLMRNLQSMQNELERSGNDARRRLEENVARLEAQATDLREKINVESDNARQSALRRELEAKTFQERIDRLTAEHGTTREKLVAAETSQTHLEERVRDLALQVEAKEEKLALYEGRNATGDASQSPEEQLQASVAELRNELRSTKGELERAKEHVKQYQAIAETQGVSLQEVTATYEEYRTAMDAATAEKDSELASLRERLHALTTDLTASNNQNSDLHRQIEAERVAFEKERKTFEDGMAALRSADQEARDAQIAAQDDMRRQAQVARDAHEKYERELVAHAEDVKRLSEVKGELEAVRGTVREYQAAAETAKANLLASEESWQRQKDVLQQELADVRKRSDELKEQNGILADHLEKATASAATLQSRHASQGDDTSGASATSDSIEAITASHHSSVEQLREVIRYLRREKDIIDLQLDFSKQEASRLRQQLDFTSRSLEEARQALQEERQRAGDTLSSSAQHAELLESIHTAKLLRESNQTLRDENEANVRKLATLDTQLRQVQAEMQPLQEQLRSLQAELEAKDHQIKLLEEDNERWKTRNQTILAKYERIDPEELQVLKAEVEKVQASLTAVQAEKAAVTAQVEEQAKVIETQRVSASEASQRFKGLQGHARTQRTAIDELKKEVEDLKKEIEDLKKAAEESKQQAASAPAADAAASQELLQKQQRIDTLEAEKSALEAEKANLETKLATVEREKAEALKAIEERLATVQAAHDTVNKERERLAAREGPIFKDNKQMRAAAKIREEEIAAKDAELATLRAELETLRASIASDNAAAIEAVVQARLAEAAPAPAAPTDEQVAAAAKEQLAAAEARFAEQREEAVAQAVKQAAMQFEQELEKVRSELAAARAAAPAGGDSATAVTDAEATKKAVEEAVETAKRELTADFDKVKEAVKAEAVRKEQETIARLDAALKDAQEQVKTATEAAAAAAASSASTATAAGAVAPPDIEGLVQAKVAALEKERTASQQQAIEKAVQEAIAKQQQVVKKAVADALAKQAAEHEKLIISTKEQAERQAAMKNNLLQKSLNTLRAKLTEKEKGLAAAAGGNAAVPATTPAANSAAPAPTGLASLPPPPASLPATPAVAQQTAGAQSAPAAAASGDASPGRGGAAAARGRGGLARRGGRGGKAVAGTSPPATPTGPKATGAPGAPAVRQAKGPGGVLGSILGAAAAANAQSQVGGAKRPREDGGDGANKGGAPDPSKRPKP